MLILKAPAGTISNFSDSVICIAANRSVSVSKINDLFKNLTNRLICNIIMGTIIIFHIGAKLNFPTFIAVKRAKDSTFQA